jgi:hypothetical protein
VDSVLLNQDLGHRWIVGPTCDTSKGHRIALSPNTVTVVQQLSTANSVRVAV